MYHIGRGAELNTFTRTISLGMLIILYGRCFNKFYFQSLILDLMIDLII